MLPILSSGVTGGKQTRLTEYDIKLFEPSEERFQKISKLTKQQQTKLAIAVIQLQNQIRSVRK
jgi:hypothetical protein